MAEESDATAWTKVSNPDGREYYWNKATNETTWEKPQAYKSSSERGIRNKKAEWERVQDGKGRQYWWNTATNETRWSSPFPDGLVRTNSERLIRDKEARAQVLGKPRKISKKISSTRAPLVERASRKEEPAIVIEIDSVPPPSAAERELKNNSGKGSIIGVDSAKRGHSEQVIVLSGVEYETKEEEEPLGRLALDSGKQRAPIAATGTQVRHKEHRKNRRHKLPRKPRGFEHLSGKLRFSKKYSKRYRDIAEPESAARQVEIGRPFEVEHRLAVTFDKEKVRYDGMPSEWGSEALRQFGLPLNSCPRVPVPGFEARVPVILVRLRSALEAFDGFKVDGIFRVSPDATKCAEIKRQIDTGAGLSGLYEEADAHITANLIKQFYRDLQSNILNSLSREQIMEMVHYSEDEQYEFGLSLLGESERTAFLWLLHLLADVAQYQEVNRMTAKNLAIVVSPNLFSTESTNPMETLVLSQKIAVVVTNYLSWIVKKRTSAS